MCTISHEGHFGLEGGEGVRGVTPPPLCDIPSGCRSFTGPWTVTRSSLRTLRRVAAFCRPLRPVLLLVSFPRSRSPVVGVLGLCWLRRDVPRARQWRPVNPCPKNKNWPQTKNRPKNKNRLGLSTERVKNKNHLGHKQDKSGEQ